MGTCQSTQLNETLIVFSSWMCADSQLTGSPPCSTCCTSPPPSRCRAPRAPCGGRPPTPSTRSSLVTVWPTSSRRCPSWTSPTSSISPPPEIIECNSAFSLAFIPSVTSHTLVLLDFVQLFYL